MGVLLTETTGWAVAGWATSSFFEDCLNIISRTDNYFSLKSDIEEVISLSNYSFTLDYRQKDKKYIFQLYDIVTILIFEFDNIYSDNLNKLYVINYKNSISNLKEILIKHLMENP